MDPPCEESLVRALEQLYLLGAVEKNDENDKLKLTPLGQKMAHFPLEPSLAKAIINSEEHSCGVEVLSVVSMLSVDSVLYTPHNKREKVLATRKKFVSLDGDHLKLLNIYRAYKSAKGNKVLYWFGSLLRKGYQGNFDRFFFVHKSTLSCVQFTLKIYATILYRDPNFSNYFISYVKQYALRNPCYLECVIIHTMSLCN